jgi:hypothetical protein
MVDTRMPWWRGVSRTQVRRALQGSAFGLCWFWVFLAQAQVTDNQVGAFVEALRLAAPQTGRDDDGLYSDWKIKPANIPRWSKRCLGKALTPTEFAANPDLARTILACVMRQVLQDQYNASAHNESVAVQRAASWWMTGDPGRYDDKMVVSYTSKVLNFYEIQIQKSPDSMIKSGSK